MLLSAHELHVQVPIIVSRHLSLGLVVQLDIQCHLTYLGIAKTPLHNWQMQPRTFGRPFWVRSWSWYRRLMAISRPSQRQKVLYWEGTHDSTQYSQVNAGSSSCVQLTPVYSRESWLSLHTPLAILTTSPATTVGTQVLRPHLNTQR